MMLPWGAMLRAAMARGVCAQAFWQLSLREWCWLAETGTESGLSRGAFEALMADDLRGEDIEDGRD